MHALLGDYVGDCVIVRYDPMNLASLKVYAVDALEEERFLCQAESVERGGQEVSLQEIVAARTKRRKRVGKEVRERKRAVSRSASARLLAERALKKVSSPATSIQSVSAVEEVVSASVCPEPSDRCGSKMVWYDDEVPPPATLAQDASVSSEVVSPCVLLEPSDSFPSRVRWYDDE